MNSLHSRKITISFTVVLALMLIMILFDLNRMNIMNEKLNIIVKEHNVKSDLMVTIQNSIYERQVILRNILLMDDVFERDEGKTKFNSYAVDIVMARNQFSRMKLSDDEKLLLNDINSSMATSYIAQMEFIDKSIYDENFEIDQEEINATFIKQEDFSNKIEKVIKLQNTATKEAVLNAESSYNAAKKSVYFLGGGALLFALFIAIYIIRHTESQARDINKAISELEESREYLEVKVKARTEQLSQARDAALASNKAKDAFIATMSHELRTPLNIIIGYSEILEEVAEEENAKNFIPDLKKIQSAANHQLELVSGILDITKIEEGKLDLNPIEFDIESLISEVDSSAKPLVLQNNNSFTVKCSYGIGMMYSDNMRIRQILLNFLSNAAKFTSDGKVILNVSKSSQGDDIIFSVQDTGLGIPENYIDHLFDRFSQEDSSTTRKYGGSGLGLFITKQLAQMLKGDVTVQSKKGEGSTFTLSLPVVYTEQMGQDNTSSINL